MPRDLRDWQLTYCRWEPTEQPLREALTTLGNGYFATRGAHEEASASDVHYPGTYLAGGYDRQASSVAGRIVENEDLVNWPNWLPLTFRCDDDDWFRLERTDVLDYEVRLDLLRGVLHRRVRFSDGRGREFTLHSRRFVHMGRPHVAALSWELTPLNWSGTIHVRSGLDGTVTNSGVPRYRQLTRQHIDVVHTGAETDGVVCLVARARQSGLVVAEAARLRIDGSQDFSEGLRSTRVEERSVSETIRAAAIAQRPLRLEKIVTLYTSRDFAISDPKTAATTWVHRHPGFDALLESHERAWRRIWNHTDLQIESDDPNAQAVLRLHLFHLHQTASAHSVERDVGLPARGLHGEAYRGHVFWDELFAFPLFNFRVPELTRAFLLYRFRRLDQARWAARQEGFEGALFPWQSGSDGREETQTLRLNPRSGRWLPDNTHRQRHVNAAIAYNVWQYFQVTGDRSFLATHGAELLLEIARFWASIAQYDPARDRYVIRGVVGPDEFHTRCPDCTELGVDNNAYTNVMAAWTLKTALESLNFLLEDRKKELLSGLRIEPGDLERWDEIGRKLFVPFHGDRIISQFEGWDDLAELDWTAWSAQYGNIRRLDRLLEAAGDDVNRYKATKQADVLMLFFLLSEAELRQLFARLGYEWSDDLLARNVEYYLARTSHGSTLSQVVHAWVLARLDRKHSWTLFREALASDIDDVQGGTTAEGIHIGAMAGTIDLLQRGYLGLEARDDVLWLNPQLPEELRRLRLRLRYREHWLALDVGHGGTSVTVEPGPKRPLSLKYRGETYVVPTGETRWFEH